MSGRVRANINVQGDPYVPERWICWAEIIMAAWAIAFGASQLSLWQDDRSRWLALSVGILCTVLAFPIGLHGVWRLAEIRDAQRRAGFGMREAAIVGQLVALGGAMWTWTCPQCRTTTRNAQDIRCGYCAACRAHTGRIEGDRP
jgi:hypothetical protein